MRAKLDKLTGNLRESDLPSGVDLPAMQQQAHRHDNKSVLDKIGEADGQLLFDGAAVGGGDSVATQTENGLMSAADKTKLDGLGGVATQSVSGLMSKEDKTKLDKFGEADGALTFNGQPVGGGTADSVAWENVTGKPSTFPPETHQHAISDVTGLQDALDSVGPFLVWNGAHSLRMLSGTGISVGSGGFSTYEDIELDVADLLDTGTIQSGKDYCVYLTTDKQFVVSLNSTFPSGTLSDGSTAFSAENTRKIGGFHTLCVDAGEIDEHPLSGFSAGDILPASVWCLNHRPYCEPAGMVYCSALDFWVDIYLQSGTGEATESVFGGTITHTRCQPDHTEDMFSVRKKLLSDEEFSAAAEGSNQQTSISPAAIPDVTGGHYDSYNRRMLSNIGCEDCCGAVSEWLRDIGPAGSGTGTWVSLPGGKGETHGALYALAAGGDYSNSTSAGSRSRIANCNVSLTSAGLSARGMSYNRNREE